MAKTHPHGHVKTDAKISGISQKAETEMKSFDPKCFPNLLRNASKNLSSKISLNQIRRNKLSNQIYDL